MGLFAIMMGHIRIFIKGDELEIHNFYCGKENHEKKKVSIIIVHDYVIFNAFHSSHLKIGKIIQTLVIMLFLWAFEYFVLIRFIPNCFIYFHNIFKMILSKHIKNLQH